MASTTSINDTTAVINPPKSQTSSLIEDLLHIHEQGQEFREGDGQVEGGGKLKKFQVQQVGGKNKKFQVRAKNMKQAAAIGFAKMDGQGLVFKVNGKLYTGNRRKIGNKFINEIQQH